MEPLIREKMVLVQEAGNAVRKSHVHLKEPDPDKEVCFIWESNYQIWHDQVISKGRRPAIEVDIFKLLSFFLSAPGMWAIAPVSVANYSKQTQDISIHEIADKRKPPERITYIQT